MLNPLSLSQNYYITVAIHDQLLLKLLIQSSYFICTSYSFKNEYNLIKRTRAYNWIFTGNPLKG